MQVVAIYYACRVIRVIVLIYGRLMRVGPVKSVYLSFAGGSYQIGLISRFRVGPEQINGLRHYLNFVGHM